MSSAGKRKKRPKKPTGEHCRRFGFAILQGARLADQIQRRRAAVDHLFSLLEGGDIVDEWEEDNAAWVVVEPFDEISVDLARVYCEETPRYVRGSFGVDRSA